MDLDDDELKATREFYTKKNNKNIDKDIERLRQFLVGNKYCEDCNEKCVDCYIEYEEVQAVANVLSELEHKEKRIKSKERVINSQKEYIKCLEEYVKELGGEI